MKEDLRVSLTKKMLQEGLLHLLKSKSIEKVTITELCEVSGVNRATFYRHYNETADVLNDFKNKIMTDLRILAEKDDIQNNPKVWIADMCQYIHDHADVMKILIDAHTDEDFISIITGMYTKNVDYLKKQGFNIESEDDKMRLATYYYAGGIHYIFRQWILEPIKKSPEEVAELIANLMGLQ